jgi:hypothetical protein
MQQLLRQVRRGRTRRHFPLLKGRGGTTPVTSPCPFLLYSPLLRCLAPLGACHGFFLTSHLACHPLHAPKPIFPVHPPLPSTTVHPQAQAAPAHPPVEVTPALGRHPCTEVGEGMILYDRFPDRCEQTYQ